MLKQDSCGQPTSSGNWAIRFTYARPIGFTIEFAEAGINERLGYTSPADVVDRYPAFFWTSVSAQIAPAVRHLKVTAEGRRWLAQLHANVFRAEHRDDLNEHEK